MTGPQLVVQTSPHVDKYDYFVFSHPKQSRPLITITLGRVLIVHMPLWQRVMAAVSLVLTGRMRMSDES